MVKYWIWLFRCNRISAYGKIWLLLDIYIKTAILNTRVTMIIVSDVENCKNQHIIVLMFNTKLSRVNFLSCHYDVRAVQKTVLPSDFTFNMIQDGGAAILNFGLMATTQSLLHRMAQNFT